MGHRFARRILRFCVKRPFAVLHQGTRNEQWSGYDRNCSVCGFVGYFHRNPEVASIRENFRCNNCGASLRYREQARVILAFYSRQESRNIEELVKERAFRKLSIYEPGLIGQFRKHFRTLDNYATSYFWNDVPIGEYNEGVQCQDLMRLQYDDASFDLVVTSDIFEHVRRPFEGFLEINRVLKPGGMHIFSIPVQHPMRPKTVFRVDTSGDDDVFILPPHYHGAPKGGKSLVYADFGSDIVETMNQNGIELRLDPPAWSGNMESVTDRMITFYWIK